MHAFTTLTPTLEGSRVTVFCFAGERDHTGLPGVPASGPLAGTRESARALRAPRSKYKHGREIGRCARARDELLNASALGGPREHGNLGGRRVFAHCNNIADRRRRQFFPPRPRRRMLRRRARSASRRTAAEITHFRRQAPQWPSSFPHSNTPARSRRSAPDVPPHALHR